MDREDFATLSFDIPDLSGVSAKETIGHEWVNGDLILRNKGGTTYIVFEVEYTLPNGSIFKHQIDTIVRDERIVYSHTLHTPIKVQILDAVYEDWGYKYPHAGLDEDLSVPQNTSLEQTPD